MFKHLTQISSTVLHLISFEIGSVVLFPFPSRFLFRLGEVLGVFQNSGSWGFGSPPPSLCVSTFVLRKSSLQSPVVATARLTSWPLDALSRGLFLCSLLLNWHMNYILFITFFYIVYRFRLSTFIFISVDIWGLLFFSSRMMIAGTFLIINVSVLLYWDK